MSSTQLQFCFGTAWVSEFNKKDFDFIKSLLLTFSNFAGDSCCFPFSMGMLKKLIEKTLNNTVYVKSLEIGGSYIRDYESSYFIHPRKQVFNLS